MKFAAVLTATIGVALLTSCGSSGGTSLIPPVIAQSGYSNASLTGTYSLFLASTINDNNAMGYSEDIGAFIADGAGNLTSGTLAERFAGTAVCTLTFTVTYSLQSTASGAATLVTKSTLTSGTGTCRPNETLTFSIFAGQSGASLLFNESDGTGLLAGSATKQ
jgi:hypothetical protein